MELVALLVWLAFERLLWALPGVLVGLWLEYRWHICDRAVEGLRWVKTGCVRLLSSR